jgi:alpha-L-glutamate ligase-like protein
MFDFFKKRKKILGMNARNLEYIRPYNRKSAKKIADEKLLTKKFLAKAGIKTPKVLGVINNREDLYNFDFKVLPDSFVIKPNRGYAGGGIRVFFGKSKKGGWIEGSGNRAEEEELRKHIINILDGNFSLRGVPDMAFIETRVKIAKLLKPYSFRGIPDVRVIVFNKVPVMAMLRLPTERSKGKGNVTMGAIGVGVDIATGITTTAIVRSAFKGSDRVIEYVPKTRLLLSGIQIPDWDDILKMSVKAQKASKLGFLGVDIAIDRDMGPVILELNARPGLSIQNANRAPLKERLERVQGLKVKDEEHGVRIAKSLFGGELKQEVEDMIGKKVIGVFEKVSIEGKNKKKKELDIKVDTGAYSSSIDEAVARELGYGEVLDVFEKTKGEYEKQLSEDNYKNEEVAKKYGEEIKKLSEDILGVAQVRSSHGVTLRPRIKIRLILGEKEIESGSTVIDRVGLKFKMIVGRRDLKHFVIDPSRILRK